MAVKRLRAGIRDGRFVAETTQSAIVADNVVIATGPYQKAIIPEQLNDNTSLSQLHASRYRAPQQLPRGAVLIVGSGASGTQITEELVRADRQVYLSVGGDRRMPRRYRGHDLIWWLTEQGLDQMPVQSRGPDKALPLITGAYADPRRRSERGTGTVLPRPALALENEFVLSGWDRRRCRPAGASPGLAPTLEVTTEQLARRCFRLHLN